jgi:hypothetical protein
MMADETSGNHREVSQKKQNKTPALDCVQEIPPIALENSFAILLREKDGVNRRKTYFV